MTGIRKLLEQHGLPSAAKVKILRHKDKRCDVEQLYTHHRKEFEDYYQAYPTKDIFNCDYVISCIGTPDLRARFIGVYQVLGKRAAIEHPPSKNFIHYDQFFPDQEAIRSHIWYNLKKVSGFETLENNLEIHYGNSCQLCHFEFSRFYGALAEGFIHVHHLKPISTIGPSYKIDPIKDLIPVCPNCHAAIHRREPPYSLEEIREAIRENEKPCRT